MTKTINPDVAAFKDDFFKGLSFRECVFGGSALFTGVGGILLLHFYFGVGINTAITLCMPVIGIIREEILQKAVSKEMERLAKEYHKLIEKRLQEGRGGLLQSKYFIVSCRKPDYESARNYFNTIEFSIQQLFHRLGSCLIPLDATERLRALYSYYRMGDEASFSFDWNEYLKVPMTGH